MKRFDSHKWINKLKSGKVLNEGPADDALLKKLRIQVPGEKFPELKVWWEYEPSDIMTYVYWHQGQLPPTGPAFEKEWNNLVKQLHVRYPIPAEELDRVLPKMDLDTRTEREISVDVPDRYSEATKDGSGLWQDVQTGTKDYELGDKWSSDFDYVGMLKVGSKTYLSDGLNVMNDLYDSFEDVNYHRENKDLGNAIEWYEDRKGIEDEERAQEFMERFRQACLKTLRSIERK